MGDSVQDSIEKITLEDTLKKYFGSTRRYQIHHWDVDQPIVGFGFGFYKKIIALNPKYLVVSSYDANTYFHPGSRVLKRLRRKGIRPVALWWDTCNDAFVKSALSLREAIEKHCVIDNPQLDLGPSEEGKALSKQMLALYSPYTQVFPRKKRDLDVVFMGQIDGYRGNRWKFLEYLLSRRVALYYTVNSAMDQSSHSQYQETLARSKIGINFSMSVDRHQLKARVFETMLAGSLLLEQRNPQTGFYFTEGKEYVAFATPTELYEKINYYLAHEDERIKIANAGQRKVREIYNGERFWKSLLGESS
jgi:hypothetical protein